MRAHNSGVIASVYFKQRFTITKEQIVVGGISLNGTALTALTAGMALSKIVADINTKAGAAGITATQQGGELWLGGANVQSVIFIGSSGGIGE